MILNRAGHHRNRFLGFGMERGVGDGRAGESWAGGGRVPPLQPALGTQYPYSKTICKNCTAFPPFQTFMKRESPFVRVLAGGGRRGQFQDGG